jgi:type II secretory pathway component PulK
MVRRGFAMLTVLWVMTLGATLAAAAALVGRNAVNASRNRVHLERAFWVATGCMSTIRSAIDAQLEESATPEDAASSWRELDRVVLSAAPSAAECTIELTAAGTRLDVNAASDEMVERLLQAIGSGGDAASMIAALGDWRDSDDVARPDGGERQWYETEQRAPPRNGPLSDSRELARVRGFEDFPKFDSVLTTEPGRVFLRTAPASVLRAIPGITEETADQIVAQRLVGNATLDPLSLLGVLSQPSADTLLARYADVARLTTRDPDAWILSVRSLSGEPAVSARLEVRLVRAGRRCIVVRSRSQS